MKEQALRSKVLQTDDTPVGVLDPQRARTRTGRIWTYVGDDEHPYTVYDYTPTRNRDGPHAFLEPFRGYLQADAYSGYDELYQDPKHDVTEVACWAHTRRKFYEAQSSDLMRSTVMLAYIRLLYDVEREARDQNLDREGRRALRQAKAQPILGDIRKYLEREQLQALPKSPIGQAIAYALSNWEALLRYVQDGDLEIDKQRRRAQPARHRGRTQELALLWKRPRRPNRGRADQLRHHVQTTRHRSVGLPARPLRPHQRASAGPPRRTAP